MEDANEEQLLRAVTLQNARAILLARERAERALRESEERLRVTLASIGDGVIVCDAHGNVTYLNPVAEALTGWTQADGIGEPLDEVFRIVIEETRETVDNPFSRVVRDGAIVGFANHTVLIARDGKERTIDDSAAPIRDAEGNIAGVVLSFRDVTERRQAEILLKSQKDTLEMLLQNLPLPQVLRSLALTMEKQSRHKVITAIHLLDKTGTRFDLAVAPSLSESYCLATKGMDVASRAGPCCVAVLTRKRATVSDVDADTQWKAFAEFARPLGIRAGWSTPVFSSRGEIVGTFANYYDQPREPDAHDIAAVDMLTSTVALAIERERAQSDQSHLAAIIEWSEDAIVSKDLDGFITSWNKGAEHLFGYTAAEALGQSVTMLIPEKHLDEEPGILQRIRRGESVDHYETLRRRKDGTLLDVSLTVSPIRDSSGRISGASKFARDITERKRAERLLAESESFSRGIFESSPDCVKVLDTEGKLVRMNANGLCLMEIDDFTAFEGRPWAEMWPEDARQDVQIAIEAARAEGVGFFKRYCPTAKGTPKWWDVRVAPIHDACGNVVRFVSVSRDITTHKLAETERERLLESEQQARLEADVANRTKDEFLATVSHELRTPLNAILGWTYMLMRGNLDEKATARGLETIARSANAQNQLISDLLDVSRIISGQLRFETCIVDLNQVIEAATETVRPAADAKGIDLQLTLNSEAGLVSGDPTRLQQIIWNLLTNAVKFTSRDGSVKVRLKRQGTSVAIIVSDTGEGISAEFVPYIFDRFRQAESTTKRQQGGLGLGLAIVRHLVEAHGGTIRAASEGLGKGASFTVTLPSIAVSGDGTADARKGLADHASFIILKGLRVLVIDDESDARELLTLALTQSGAQVKAAATVREGLDMLEEWKPDVLVSDIGMPSEDGYDLIRSVRALESEKGGRVPALALTGYASAEDALRARHAGFQTHMSKPVAPSDLVRAVANLAANGLVNAE